MVKVLKIQRLARVAVDNNKKWIGNGYMCMQQERKRKKESKYLPIRATI